MEENYDLTDEERAEAIAGLEAAALSKSKRAAAKNVEYSDIQVLEDDEEFEKFDNDDDWMDETYQPPHKKRPTPSPALSASSSTKGKKKELEHDVKVAICHHVRNYPPLYQITHQNYSNRAEKDAIWEQISKSLCKKFGPEMTVQKCRKLWDALRESTR